MATSKRKRTTDSDKEEKEPEGIGVEVKEGADVAMHLGSEHALYKRYGRRLTPIYMLEIDVKRRRGSAQSKDMRPYGPKDQARVLVDCMHPYRNGTDRMSSRQPLCCASENPVVSSREPRKSCRGEVPMAA